MAVQTLLDECLSIRGGRLFIEECDADELARRFGTPFTVMSEDQLRRNARRYRREFEARWPAGPVVVLASIKANFALATRWILSQEGLGCDTFGAGELHAALEGGVAPDRISVNGAIKDQPSVEAGVRGGARIPLDSTAELARVREAARRLGHRATIRFRIRPDFSTLTEPTDWYEEPTPIAEATRLYKAGIPTEDVIELGRRALQMPEIDLAGVHAHIGRHTNRTEQWPPIIAAYGGLLAGLRDAWNGWTPRELNLGGGYPVPRDPFGRGLARLQGRPRTAPDVSEYAGVVTVSLMSTLQQHGFSLRGLRLEIEPGRGWCWSPATAPSGSSDRRRSPTSSGETSFRFDSPRGNDSGRRHRRPAERRQDHTIQCADSGGCRRGVVCLQHRRTEYRHGRSAGQTARRAGADVQAKESHPDGDEVCRRGRPGGRSQPRRGNGQPISFEHPRARRTGHGGPLVQRSERAARR